MRPKVLQTTPNYLLGFADNNDRFMYCFCPYIDL